MPKTADRVKETTITTGTGDLTLDGAVSQFRSFNTAFGTNSVFQYAIVGQSGTEWEIGFGHLSGSTTLVRDLVKSSSNSGALVSLSAGTKNVFATIAADCVEHACQGNIVAMANGQAMP